MLKKPRNPCKGVREDFQRETTLLPLIDPLQEGGKFNSDSRLRKGAPSPGGGSIREGTAFVRCQTRRRAGRGGGEFFSHLREKTKGSEGLEGPVPSTQWVGGAGPLGHRLSAIGMKRQVIVGISL